MADTEEGSPRGDNRETQGIPAQIDTTIMELERLQRKLGLLGRVLPLVEAAPEQADASPQDLIGGLVDCLFEADGLAVAVIAGDFTLASVNNTFANLVGLSREDLQKRALSDFLPAIPQSGVTKAEAWEGDIALAQPDGKSTEVHGVLRPLPSRGEGPCSHVLILMPHAGVEAAARARAAAADDKPGDASGLWDASPGIHALIRMPDRIVERVNDGFAWFTGHAHGGLVGTRDDELFEAAGISLDAATGERLSRSLERASSTGAVDRLSDVSVFMRDGGGDEPSERVLTVVHTPLPAGGGINLVMRTLEDVTAARRAERERTRESRLLRMAEETAAIGTWRLDPATGRINLSDAAAGLLGVRPGTVFDRWKFAALVGEEERGDVLSAIDRCAQDGHAFKLEHALVGADDVSRDVCTAGIPEEEENRRPFPVSGVFYDLTGRREAEREARRSGRRTRSLAEAVPVKVFMAGPDGSLVYLNEAFREFVADGEAGGALPLLARVHPEDAQDGQNEWEAALQEERPFIRDLRLRRADGAYRWHNVISVPVRDEVGRIEAWYGAASDIEDLKVAQGRSRVLSDRLQSILGSVRDGLISIDHDWTVTFLNEGGERLLRRSREGIVGKNFWESFPAIDGEELHGNLRYAMESGQKVAFEYFDKTLNAWLNASVYPSVMGLTILFRDVTERRRRFERLRLMETALATMDDMVLITEASPLETPGPRLIYVNDAFTRVTGYRPEEVIGKSPRILQGKDTDRGTLEEIRRSLERDEPVRTDVKNYTKDGRPYWIDLSITPLHDEELGLSAFVSVQRDETERRRQRALVDWQARMLDQANDAVVVTDLSGIVQYWNRCAADLYGWSADEVMGRPLDDVLAPEGIDFEAARQEVRQQGFWHDRMTHCTRGGHMVKVGSKWALIDGQEGGDASIMLINRDLAARLMLDEEINRLMRLDALGQMTGGIAHDFNNILTIMLGSADMTLAKAQDRPEIVRLATMGRSAAERGRELVQRLLAFARRQELTPAPHDVNALVNDLKAMLNNALEEQVELELNLSDDLQLAQVDPSALEQALMNLCLNSRDALMPAGGRITIESRNRHVEGSYIGELASVAPGDYVELSVSDNGCGMDAETRARVLEPFFSTKGDESGTGLGLSMVYGFIRQSGGHMKIYSEPDKGTTVRLWLPVPGADAEGAAHRREDDEGIPRGSETVLLVEDDADVRGNVKEMVEGLGYTVVESANADDALSVLRARDDIALLFTDVIMRGSADGLELAKSANTLQPGLPVLFTSGYTGAALEAAGGRAEKVQLLSKPYRVDELARALRRAIDRTG